MKSSNFYNKKNRISRYITKALRTLDYDLKKKVPQEQQISKMTEEGEIVVNDFLEYDFSLSSQCAGYYFYWY